MDTQAFLAQFGHIASAPDGMAQLRKLILCLALQGKLVSQNAGDQSGHNVLLDAKRQRATLTQQGKIRSKLEGLPIERSEVAHDIPSSWAWVRFGDISQHNSGKTLDAQRNSGVARDYITTSNLYWGRFDLSSIRQMLIEDGELERCTAIKGDLLICEGGEAGRAAVWNYDHEVSFQNHIHRARLFADINPFYVYRVLEKLNFTGEINRYRKGVGISNMSSNALASIPVPLPPLAEQARIVAKVDELMALCEKMEAQQVNAVAKRAQTITAHLTRFTDLMNPVDILRKMSATDWTDPAAIRKAVYRAAVLGRLRPQSQQDTPVTEILEKLALLPNPHRYDSRSSARIQGLAALSVGLTTRAIPSGWACVPLVRIARMESGHTPSRSHADWWNGDVPWVGIVDAREHDGKTIYDTRQHTNAEGLANSSARLLPTGTVCISRTASVGYVVMLGKPMATSQDFVNWVPTSAVTSDWLRLVFTAEKDGFQRFSKGAVHQTIYFPEWLSMHILLPPVAEQQRIIAELDHLMDCIDRWELQLKQKSYLAERFAIAATAALTGITTAPAEEPMKPPVTTLDAPVHLGTPPVAGTTAPLAVILARHPGGLQAKDLWQRFGGGDFAAFYAQLKREVAAGWIREPQPAAMHVREAV